MKKAYIQPELELLKVSASNDFLIGSPEAGTYIPTTGGATDNNFGGADENDFAGGDSTDRWA